MKEVKLFLLIGIIILFSVIFSLSGFSTDNQIGYEYVENGAFLHTWNQNPLGEAESNIWQNVTSGYTQFFNGINLDDARNRSTWLKNEFGLGYYQNTNLLWLSQDHLSDFTNIVSSDNQTYWNQSIYKCKTYNNKEYCAGWIRGQKLNDKYMENSFTWWAPNQFNFNAPIYYIWKLKGINIENDDDYDTVYYCHITNTGNETEPYYDKICSYFTLNNANFFEILNLTSFEVKDRETRRGHVIVWNDTINMKLRYEGNGNTLLMSKINDINTQDKVELYWIDAGEVPCNSGNGIICINDNSQVTGYINNQGLSFTAYNNTSPRTGRDRNSPIKEWRAYYGFNTSLGGIPKNAHNFTIKIWNGLTAAQPINNGPSDWKTKIYVCGNNCVADGSGLEGDISGDWNDGNDSGIEIDWSSECGGSNEPCEVYITIANSTLGNIVLDEFNQSLQNNRWFHVIYRDSSAYQSGQNWYKNWDISGSQQDSTIRTLLNITYDVPEKYFNVNQTAPNNNSFFNTRNIDLYFNGIVGGDYYSDYCDFNFNGTVIRNNTDVYNGSIGMNKTYEEAPDGVYWWELNCTNQIGHKAFSGRKYFILDDVTCRFSDDFENASLSDIKWGNTLGSNSVANGYLNVSSHDLFHTRNFTQNSVYGCWEWAFRNDNSTFNRSIAWMLMDVSNSSHRYQLRVAGHNSSTNSTWNLSLFRYEENDYANLTLENNTGISSQNYDWHKATFCYFSNNTWSTYFDNVLQGNFIDTTAPSYNYFRRAAHDIPYKDYNIENVSFWLGTKEQNDCWGEFPDIVYNETLGRQAILEGINNIITNSLKYQDKKMYTVTLDKNHTVGYFDVSSILTNQTWTFNYLTGGDAAVNLNSLRHIVNVWEKRGLTYDGIVTQVENLINATLS